MSDFKIARLKYTWKGNWATTTEYKPDDVVAVGGKAYSCLLRHESSPNFFTDLNFVNGDIPPASTPRWIQIADGVKFVGDWQTSRFYAIGDIAAISGGLYICEIDHTSAELESGFDNDFVVENRWAIFVLTDNWSQEWQTSTYYGIGSLVRYGGEIWRCITGHTSSQVDNPGLYDDAAKWEKVSSSQDWRGDWNNSSLYIPRDVVRYGGKIYQCVNQHGSSGTLLNNINDWQLLVDGIDYLGEFATDTTFKLNDIVKYGAYLYICIEGHQSLNSPFDETKWQIFCPGSQYEFTWDETTAYEIGDVVRHGGYVYTAVAYNLNSQPTYEQGATNTDWRLLIDGTRIRGDWSSTSAYLPGDIVRRGANLYVAVTEVVAGTDVDLIGDGSTLNSDFWKVVSTGSLWKSNWTIDESYVLGDVVVWRGASYKCIAKHIADNAKRPDTDGGVHWDNLLYGDPNNVLSLPGDLKYFDSAAPTNLSVGTAGQTLKAVSTSPAWNNFNGNAATFYVSLNGIDDPTRGATPNAPWRTVRYALDRITGPATLFVRTGTFEEILPLKIPASVAVVGDELRSTKITPAENYFSSEDINRYDNVLTFISGLLSFIIKAQPVSIQYGPVFIKQDTSAPAAGDEEVTLADTNLTVISAVMTGSLAFEIISTNTISIDADELAAATQLENNLTFIQSEVKAWLTATYPLYVFVRNTIDVSVERIISSLIYDLRYIGNYKSIQAGTYFYHGSNATANKLSNMFLLGNATGLRNMTLTGLSGELGPFNEYLTQRPTAGAYASLDPGWGVNDETAWITARSPYVQNVTTFGDACVGLKVDGDLHTGGNKTIVCNDFTQILSDGIGLWCNGEGASEAVSVFSYYNHIGYLCTAGGKIRGTNGNCSYGKYGAVAEEFDPTEIPITATVNTRFFDAEVGQVFTNGTEILQVFYSNAGQNYTSATMSVTGAGINASLLPDEFRDQSVFQARVANPDDSTTPGGSGYTLAINNAQAGDPYYIQLSAADTQLEDTYVSLRLVINSGTGAGQYGYIAAFNDSNKIALIGDERFATYEITETISTGNKIAIDFDNRDISYGEYDFRVGDRVCFGGTAFGNLTKNTVYVITDFTSNQLELEDEFGSPIVVTDDTGSMTMYVLGFWHIQPGRQIAASLNTTTSYQIEPRLIFDAPNKTVTLRSLPVTGNWASGAFGNNLYVVLQTGVSDVSLVSNDGALYNTAAIPSGDWTKVAFGNDLFVAVSADGKLASTVDGETWSLASVPGYEYSSVAYGNGVWIAVASGGANALRSVDGSTWTPTALPEGADWTDIAYGKGKFVAVAQSDSTITSTAYTSDNGLTWNTGSFLGGCAAIAYGNNRFVAIEGGYGAAEKTFISFDGITWLTGELPESRNYSDITYGQGHFVAVSSTASNSVYYSVDGLRWAFFESLEDTTGSGVFFGSTSADPGFYVLRSGSDIAYAKAGARTQGRTVTVSNRLAQIRLWETGSGYTSLPSLEIIDPNNVADSFVEIRIASGVLGPPTLLNSGDGWLTVSTRIAVSGDGFRDGYPIGNELIVDAATRIPGPGDNLRINGIDDYIYRVLSATVLNGTLGNYRLRLQIAKALDVNESPIHGTAVTIRQKYSQVRLTGHDFLDIGLGNFTQSNYPDTLFPNGTVVSPENEVLEKNGGRVFYTSTDQDGNFRVGELFSVEQATGTVTISADFFELEGLEELSIGGISVGGTGVVIREFSTDPLFVADSNNILSTQRAIKAFIARRISGGGSDAFTSTFTAGIVRVGPNLISTTTLDTIQIPVKVNFTGPIEGFILAEALFLGGEGFFEG
jgi:hypothetical protein